MQFYLAIAKYASNISGVLDEFYHSAIIAGSDKADAKSRILAEKGNRSDDRLQVLDVLVLTADEAQSGFKLEGSWMNYDDFLAEMSGLIDAEIGANYFDGVVEIV